MVNTLSKSQPQYITDSEGKKVSVIIPIEWHDRLLDALEELEDIRLYDSVKSRNEKTISFDDYLKKRKAARKA